MFRLAPCRVVLVVASAALAIELKVAAGADQVVDGQAVLRGQTARGEIVLTTTARLAGAIHSLHFAGREYIDSTDHGRQLQSACSFDCAQPGPFWAECYNPTEAGSRRDGAGAASSSKLLRLDLADAQLTTTTQMAFWLTPGESSAGRPALNTTVLSNHRLTKQVRIGYDQLKQVLDYRVTFTVPAGEVHRLAQFEALTGYLPADFARFYCFRAGQGTLEPLTDGPGEQPFPVVFATADAQHALGIFSPDQPSPGFAQAGYGRFRFPEQKVVKWNCVFRVRHAENIPAGDYRYRLFVPVGTLDEVRQALVTLQARFAPNR